MIDQKEEERLKTEATAREACDLRVLVVGGGFQYLKMFYDAGFKGAESVRDANIVCFTGGEDVDPAMYGEVPIPETFFNPKRDGIEAYLYAEAVQGNKPMVGICRGAQFLNVMNGGKLWQDVDKHAVASGHSVTDIRSGEVLHNMTSTHHQQMIAGEQAVILAAAALSLEKKAMGRTVVREKPELDDMEVLWYPDSMSLCFQPHPEFRHGECRNYFLDLVDEFILPKAC